MIITKRQPEVQEVNLLIFSKKKKSFMILAFDKIIFNNFIKSINK